MDEVDFTILAANSVLGDMIEKCPPAETCRDAFDRMSKATVQMCLSTTGFSSSSGQGLDSHPPAKEPLSDPSRPPRARPKPHFDMALHDLLGSPQTAPSRPDKPIKPEPSYAPAPQGFPSHDPDPMSYAYLDFPYSAADHDLGFLPGWEPELRGLGWEGADHDFSEGGGAGLPDILEGFYFGGAGNL
jgi:hypothetical protein